MAGCAASRWYPDTPENHLPLPLHAMFGFTRSVLICSPLHNQPPYVTLGLVATSVLILIVARFSP